MSAPTMRPNIVPSGGSDTVVVPVPHRKTPPKDIHRLDMMRFTCVRRVFRWVCLNMVSQQCFVSVSLIKPTGIVDAVSLKPEDDLFQKESSYLKGQCGGFSIFKLL